MCYVGSPFTQDIFVTYSHGADREGRPYFREWSTAFAAALDQELRVDRRFRDDLRLFLDTQHRSGQGVDPLDGLSEQLCGHIGATALLVVLMSPDYLESGWCARERQWWYESQAARSMPANARVAVVRIMPTQSKWPSLLLDSAGQELLGFTFFSNGPDVPRPLGWTDLPGPFGTEFKKALLGLVGQLYSHLDTMRKRVDEKSRADAEVARLAQASGQTIYLHGRPDAHNAWEATATALGSSGFAVVPGEPDEIQPDQKRAQEIRERRVGALSECDALLILATNDGRALDDDLVVVGKHDRQSARARSNRLLPCAVLDTVGAPVATTVRKTTARVVQADWLDATQPDWASGISGWLTGKSAQAGQV
jgi:hypothetical protein